MQKEGQQNHQHRYESSNFIAPVDDRKSHKSKLVDPSTGPERIATVKAIGGRREKAKND